MAAYECRCPIGMHQRVWLDVLAYTGLRRGDAVRFGRQYVRAGVAMLKAEKGGFTGNAADPPGARQNSRSRPVWRPHVCRRRQWQGADQGVIRQYVQIGVPSRRRPRFSPRRAQDCRYPGRREWSDRRRGRGDLRMAWRRYGLALYPRSQSGAACKRSDAQARERCANFYSRTFASGAGARAKKHNEFNADFSKWCGRETWHWLR